MSETTPPIDLFLQRTNVLFRNQSLPCPVPLQHDQYTVTGFYKTGTTWMSQIVHQLRSGGDENFEDISLVVPLLTNFPQYVDKPGATSTARDYKPTVYKTFYNYQSLVPLGGKHIHIGRNPEDTLLSTYKFICPLVSVGGVSVEDFYFRFYRDLEVNYWSHIVDWWLHRHETSKILFLHYEDLKQNLEHCIRHIADFLNIPLNEEVLNVVLHRSSYEYMLEKCHLFDGTHLAKKHQRGLDIKEEEISHQSAPRKLRPGGGQIGQGKTSLPQSVKNDMCKVWAERIAPYTGCETYDQLRKSSSLLNVPV